MSGYDVMNNDRPIITLLTDYGTDSPYIAEVKGQILKKCNRATIVDITHQIKPYDIIQAGWWLKKVYPSFPEQTIHLVGVDPSGVSNQKPIIVKAAAHLFIGANNGLLTSILEKIPYQVYEIKTNQQDLLSSFQVRDILAPLAGQLASDKTLTSQLNQIQTIVKLDNIGPKYNNEKEKRLLAKVMFVDRFGNIETNVDKGQLKRFKNPVVTINDHIITVFYSTFSSIPKGKVGLIINCYGNLAIVKNTSSAAKVLKIKDNNEVVITEKNITG